MLQLPDNCAIFTFWDSFTLLKAGENIKTIELPRRVESCLYAGIARRTGGWSAKDAYVPLCDAGEDGRFGGDGQCQNLVLLAAAGDGNGKLAEGLEQSASPVEQKPAAGRGRGYRMLREGKHRRDVACVRREVDAVI
ncbi:MAG: hypothetical protein V8S24_07340 [Gordonibacter pamelaeae]